MKPETNRRETIRSAAKVVGALAILLALAALLGARVLARAHAGGAAPRVSWSIPAVPGPPAVATVPDPGPVDLAGLPTPVCWSCRPNDLLDLGFRVDLDLLAPLGDGDANAAFWFAQFARHDGPRFGEGTDRMVDREVQGRSLKVFPADDPLLLEAEPWVDQARCSFYPEVWQVSGPETPIPNLLITLHLARSWIARGDAADDREAAREDYRRVVRLGRLLLEDDTTLIQNLVGYATVRLGATALYEEARRDGDAGLMAVAALALHDVDGARAGFSRRVRHTNAVFESVNDGWFGPTLEVSDDQVDSIVRIARRDPERTMRLEAMLALYLVRHLGTDTQRDVAGRTLEDLAEAEDPVVSAMARRVLDWRFGEENLERFGVPTGGN